MLLLRHSLYPGTLRRPFNSRKTLFAYECKIPSYSGRLENLPEITRVLTLDSGEGVEFATKCTIN